MRYDAISANAIEATGLVKRFGKTTALGGVDLVARQGRVLGVLGPNGAGNPAPAIGVLQLLGYLTWVKAPSSNLDAAVIVGVKPQLETRDATAAASSARQS